jgi:hypothetical protein
LPEWLFEEGIGEDRAVRVENGEIVEARITLECTVRVGARLNARLKSVRPRAVAEADGDQYLLPKGAPGIAEGAELVIEVTREKIPGSEPWKRPLAILSNEPPREAPPLDAQPMPFPAPVDRLSDSGWADLIEDARTGFVQFAGGELRISATPAMTLIDVDGHLSPEELAVAGASAAARAILRLDIGGSIGIDLPTVKGKAARQAAADAVDAVLPQPFERTAVNGFGFLQIVRPRLRASLVELAQDRARFEARALLRQAARETGPTRLVAHPAIITDLQSKPDWIEALARQVGGAVTLRADANLLMSGGHAEKV